jgi:uncharacterized protein (TIGR02172 family)
MNYKTTDDKLVVALDGRVDSTNASTFEAELLSLAAEHPELPVELDATDLSYISSAGLRVVMRLLRAHGAGVRVTNASPEVYDVFEMTGFASLLEVERALREVSVEGCEVVGRGGNGTVYRLDEDTIVKVYRPDVDADDIRRERDFARAAFVAGVPSVIAYDVVRVGDSLGVVFEMIRSDTLGHAMRDNPDRLEEYVTKYVALAKELHSTRVESDALADVHDHLHALTDRLDEWCTDEEVAVMHDIVDAIPHANTLVHNDLHPGNIMVQDGELLLIDMPDLCKAPPVIDLISIFRNLVSGPTSPDPRARASIEQSVGMPAELIAQVGRLFFPMYTGITDPEELEGYMQRLQLLYAFNVVFIIVAGGATGRAFADTIVENVLRKVVVPNAEAIKTLLQTM